MAKSAIGDVQIDLTSGCIHDRSCYQVIPKNWIAGVASCLTLFFKVGAPSERKGCRHSPEEAGEDVKASNKLGCSTRTVNPTGAPFSLLTPYIKSYTRRSVLRDAPKTTIAKA